MRAFFHAFPTLAVSLAAILFVAWISLGAGGRDSLYLDTPPPAAAAG
jgi:hypothetical protein